jgi:hypothetical protein
MTAMNDRLVWRKLWTRIAAQPYFMLGGLGVPMALGQMFSLHHLPRRHRQPAVLACDDPIPLCTHNIG